MQLSRYARKQKRKQGNGPISPNWMTYIQGNNVRPISKTFKPGPIGRHRTYLLMMHNQLMRKLAEGVIISAKEDYLNAQVSI